jgi:large subunit ribosomal protein L5
MQRLYTFYLKVVVNSLQQRFKFVYLNQIPKLKKIVINRGLNDSCQNSKVLEVLSNEFTMISCQSPVFVKSTKAISSFKVKEGMIIGMYLTLRGSKMYAFLDRLINLAFPRMKDFQGLSRKSFDGSGNYNLGLSEQMMFPEIEFDQIIKIEGLTISIITTAKNDLEGYFLLKELGMPFND